MGGGSSNYLVMWCGPVTSLTDRAAIFHNLPIMRVEEVNFRNGIWCGFSQGFASLTWVGGSTKRL